MNKIKLSNHVRLIAFFLTAFILVCTFGFTADGWQIFNKNNDQASGNEQPSSPDDGNTSPPEDIPTDSVLEPEETLPEFYNRLTGLECDELTASSAHLAFVMNSELPAYGLSYADLLCEVPIEDEKTRYIAFIPNADNLWKVGSVTPTRGYISNIARYFGAICISAGNDDTKYYTQCDVKDRQLDLSLNSTSHYTEYTNNVYTNRDLLISGLENSGINQQSIPAPALPFIFIDYNGKIENEKESNAQSIKISGTGLAYSTELKYDSEAAEYVLYKNSVAVADSINGKTLGYKNCFVLFADSIKYDTADCSQMIMDTIGSGTGYYFTDGVAYSITWTATGDGSLTFLDENGEQLICNRGRTYICYLKSSQSGLLNYE